MNALARRFLVSATFFISFLTPALAFAQTPAPTCTLTATPSSIIVGGSVTLKWTSTNATSGTISHIGNVAASGSLNIVLSSAQQTTFTGTFTGAGGTAICTTLVTVTTGSGSTGNSGSGAYGTTGYGTGGGNADPTQNYQTQQNSYTVDPANFTTQPSNNSFSQTPAPVSSPTSNSGVASFLVPCGRGSTAPDGDASRLYTDATSCDLCYFGQLIQNIINFLVILTIPLSAGLFAWAGILLFTSGINIRRRDDAKKIFTSVILGLVIALSGYLIVQTVLNTLLSPGFKSGGWSWNSLQCNGQVRPRSSTVGEIFQNLFNPSGTTVTTSSGTTGGVTGTGSAAQCASGNTACSVSVLQAAGLSAAQANAMSCIAVTESSGNPSTPPYNQTHPGSNSTACGLFQIVQTTWNKVPHSADCSSFSQCTNANCNTQAAVNLVQKNGYSDWTCPNCNNKAQACINAYDPH